MGSIPNCNGIENHPGYFWVVDDNLDLPGFGKAIDIDSGKIQLMFSNKLFYWLFLRSNLYGSYIRKCWLCEKWSLSN